MGKLGYLSMKWRVMGWLLLGRNKPALALLDSMIQRWPDDGYALESRAHIKAAAGDLDAALSDSARVIALRAATGRSWFNHGFMLEAAGRWDEALSAFSKATELAPGLDRAWYGLGLVLIRLQRYEEAVTALKRNTELQPMSPHGWYQLARVHVDRHEPDEALKIIRHLKGFEPKVAAQLERETGLLVGLPAT